MKLERREPVRVEAAAGALFGVVLVVGATLAALWLRLGLPRPLCLFRQWTGIPCPTCGSTRMVEALLSGRVLEAVAWNPLVFGGLAIVASWAAISAAQLAFGLPAWRAVLTPAERLALRILAALLVAAGWTYLILRA